MIVLGFLDFETTGIAQEKGHRIIEAALVLHELESKRRLGEFVTRINPERSIDADATAVHGIKFEDLVSEPTWPVIAPKLSALVGKCQYVVAHNGVGFDAPFLARELIRVGVEVPPMRVIDTMLQARWATPDGSVPNLGALCFACGVSYDTAKAHAALYDVDRMAECFFSQFDRGFFTLPTEPFVLPPAKKEGK
jgi:DNA polymerase-3 subunit epsilon